ncbi:dynamin family protein [Fulvimonas soli]|jgi:GTP-binding protein EngB required for normal cell division|uniref:Dynamin family protein n=1 Tax=Fulvimonas soli TaxID=155197 RepID=A0A316IAK3_9GAMM|nr:dynamin family protein [Fulvimonas soli]PWK89739.1 dynamin family protein [Fulvimonas soli]TNY27614.1 hypothetical protein BV497_02830 [Fulvimonas soli]
MLTENQRQHILNLLSHIEHEVQDGLRALTEQDPQALFPRYADPPEPRRVAALRAHLERLRSAMRRFMDAHGMARPNLPAVDASWAFETRMALARNAVYDLRPGYMRGYGALDEEGERDCRALAAELGLLLDDIGRELRRQPLELPAGVDRGGLLALLAEIVARHHFFELREALRRLLAGGETVEVAVLGRVSSGKSSLVNALLGQDLLPTGAIPVTAVVTRIRHGEALRIEALDAEGRAQTVAPEDLPQCIVEGGRLAGGLREVDIAVPAAMLAGGIVLTDTPGLGSLHASASAHALTYLPRCDLGIVAIDAAATLSTPDADLLRALQQAHAQRMVLLTKCDAVAPAALAQQRDYVARTLSELLGEPVEVHPVSVAAAQAGLFRHWRETVLAPAEAACAAASAERARARTLRLARQVGLRLEQGLREAPAASAPAGAPGAALAALNELEDRLRDLCARFAQNGAAVVLRDAAEEQSQDAALPQRVAGLAGELADQVVRDIAAGLGKLAAEAAPGQRDELLRGAPPFAWTPPDAGVSARGGPRFWRQWRLRRELQRQFGAPLQEALADYAQQLREWLAQACRALRQAMRGEAPAGAPAGGDAEQMRLDLQRLRAWLKDAPADGA